MGFLRVFVLSRKRSNSLTSISVEKMSIGTSTSTGPGRPLCGERECLFDDFREQVRLIGAPRALDERPIDLVLRRVRVQVHFLVRMLAVVVARNVAGDDDHRHRVERGVRHAGGRVGEARTEVRQHDRRLFLRAGVAVGRVRGDLLVPDVDELDLLALLQRGQHRDVRVAAQPEDVLDAARFEVLHQLVRNQILHCPLLRSDFSRWRRRPQHRWQKARRAAPDRCSDTESLWASAP